MCRLVRVDGAVEPRRVFVFVADVIDQRVESSEDRGELVWLLEQLDWRDVVEEDFLNREERTYVMLNKQETRVLTACLRHNCTRMYPDSSRRKKRMR